MSLHGITVLLVEDDAESRETTRRLLAAFGARVLLAPDGAQALRVLAAQSPDLVLCDLRMPVMDGFEFARRVRDDPRHRRVRLIALTGMRDPEVFLETWKLGFDGHLEKPLTIAALDGLAGATRRTAAPEPPLEQAEAHGAASRVPRRGVTALVIEDDAETREALRAMIDSFGVDVRTARSGEEAWRSIRRTPPDLILCDLEMPRLDGFALVRRVRADARLRRLLVVAMTGPDTPDAIGRMRESGFDGHLIKPLTRDLVGRVLERVTPLREQQGPA